MKGVFVQYRSFFFVVICISSHFSGWKDICQSDSHLSRLLRFTWSLMQSEVL